MLKITLVAYSSQGTTPLTRLLQLTDDSTIKSIDVDFLNHIRYFSINNTRELWNPEVQCFIH